MRAAVREAPLENGILDLGVDTEELIILLLGDAVEVPFVVLLAKDLLPDTRFSAPFEMKFGRGGFFASAVTRAGFVGEGAIL